MKRPKATPVSQGPQEKGEEGVEGVRRSPQAG